MAKNFIETPRLILREIVPEDATRLFLLDSNAEVMKYIGVPPVKDIDQTKENILKIRNQYREHGTGRWAVVEKKSELLIGWCGLKFLTEKVNGYQNIFDLSYRLLPDFWGKGIATESGKAFVDYGFRELNLPAIYAHAHCGNDSSNKILRKLGFRERGKFVDELDNAECYWYRYTKENYLELKMN